MVKIKAKDIKITVKRIADVVLPVIGYAVLGYAAKKTNRYYDYGCDVVIDYPSSTLYGRAANAIMNSYMWSCDKSEALTHLRSDRDIGYYEAVIAIAKNDDMWSRDKCNAIKKL